MDIHRAFAANLDAKGADSLQKRQALDVAYRAADFNDKYVATLARLFDTINDLAHDVRDDLDRFAQIVASALLFDDGAIDAAGGEVVVLT